MPDGKLNKPLVGLRRVRLSRGYTIRFVAEKTGFSPGYLSELETGKYAGSPETVAVLARTLAVKLVDLQQG